MSNQHKISEEAAARGRDIVRFHEQNTPAGRGQKGGIIAKSGKMSELQERFVMEFLIDLNATAAAIRAGYDPVTASRLAPKMVKPDTLTGMAIARAKAARAVRVGMSNERVLEKLYTIINTDRRALFREDGTIKAPHEFDADDQVLIESVKTRRIVEVGPDGKMQQAEIQEVKLASLTPAITLAMRHLGLLNDKLELTVQTPLAQRLAEAMQINGRQPLTTQPEGGTVIDADFEEVAGEADAETAPDDPDDLRYMLGLDD